MKNETTELAILTDKKLLGRFRRTRDERAFTELISRHGPLVMRVCRKMSLNEQDAEDAFQAVFLVLASKAGNVAWQNSIANWLYGVAWRISRNARRVAMRQKAQTVEHPGDMSEFSDTKAASLTTIDDVEQSLYPALYQLPAKYRAPIVLCHLEGKSRSQAATELGVTESVIKGRLERGRELLRMRLANESHGTMTVLTVGTLAQKISHTTIPHDTLHSLTRAATEFATGAIAAGSTSTSIALAKGELLKMLITFQLKVATIVLGVSCAAGALAASAILNPQTQTVNSNKNANAEEFLRKEWKQLNPSQRDLLTQKNLKAIMAAVIKYVDDHTGMLPPAAVPNANLLPEKRLSGFVLLLPYLNAKPIFDQIDLTKAWDDPANANAAKTIVLEFLSPDEDAFVDASGRAVSHFAFVRGSRQRDNGMFPLPDHPPLAIPDISDGTSATLAIGQIHSDFGPWIAAGASTARFITPPGEQSKTPGFGSQHAGAAYFANGDSFTYFWDVSACQPEIVHAIARRDDRIIFDSNTEFSRYTTASEWLKAKQAKGKKK